MDSQIVAIFACEDILKGLHHHEDQQCQMNDAEIMTTSIVADAFFSSNTELTRTFYKNRDKFHPYLKKAVSFVASIG